MKKIILSVCVLLSAISVARAQEFNTSYFLDNNLYSYRINPAIQGEKGFVGFALSNINIQMGSNTGISSFLFPNTSGGFVTGLHKSISADKFIGSLPKNIGVDQTFSENLLAIGFWAGKSFHNIEINVKESTCAGLPRDLFGLLKVGSSDTPYDFSALNASMKSYAELAYGYSRKIGDKFTVGGRAKFLLGLVSGNIGFNRADITMNGSRVSYDIEGSLRLSSNFMELSGAAKSDDIFDFSALNLGLNSLSPCGIGGALDLGVTYKPVDGLTLSLSVLDLGGISWKYNIVGRTSGKDEFSGVEIKTDGGEQPELDKFLDGFENLTKFKNIQGGESSFEMLSCTMNLGARYRMPFYKRLSAGLLATYRMDKFYPSIGARLGATVTPVDWLSLTGNYGINTYGKSFGAALSLNVLNINFVLGVESYSGKVANIRLMDNLPPVSSPVGSFQEMFKFGINITFGKRHNELDRNNSTFLDGKKAE